MTAEAILDDIQQQIREARARGRRRLRGCRLADGPYAELWQLEEKDFTSLTFRGTDGAHVEQLLVWRVGPGTTVRIVAT